MKRPRSILVLVAYLLAPLPAVVVGVILMAMHGVGPGLWSQQVGGVLVGTAACLGAALLAQPVEASVHAQVHPSRRLPIHWLIVAVGTVVLVAATLLFPGVEGVRRWLPVGPLRLHAAAIALPGLLLAVGVAVRGGRETPRWIILAGALLTGLILVIQPDASQATAFAFAAAMVLLMQDRRDGALLGRGSGGGPTASRQGLRNRPGRTAWMLTGALAILAALAWTRPDPLEPVPHVEGIVGLAFEVGGFWPHLAILALMILPMPFLIAAIRHAAPRAAAAALATYYGILSLMPLAGSFPVPLMGLGLSPVLGYYVGLVWLAGQSPPAGAGGSG